ncbi:MAG TPA: LuxR C-terminal-related transcriptional regulator [Myxococcaceae bacterium]|nr:LuxR C-terminal-related transcriptional regulator [Myxococcaceae bacterium]
MSPGLSSRTVHLVEEAEREREPLRRLIESLEVVVEAFGTLAERSGRASDSCNCLVWSLDGPGPGNPFDALLEEIGEGTPVVLLGRAPGLSLVTRALKAGAVDVLRSPVDVGELRRVLGEAFERSDSEQQRRVRILEVEERLERLTARERAVLGPLIRGQLNKEVGAELGITERTVKAHRGSILRKIEVGSLAELARLVTTLELARQQRAERVACARRQMLGPSETPASLSA